MVVDPADSIRLEHQIAEILAGHPPEVQGATLVCLLACWLSGHDESVENQLIAMHIEAVRELIPLYRLQQLAKPRPE